MLLTRIVALLVCLCPLSSAQTDAALWRFVHPNAKALIGIDVQRILNSRVASEMSSQLHAMPLPMELPVAFSSMDLIHSIDRVILSSPGRGDGDTKAEPPLLIAVSGRFEPVKLGRMFLKSGAKPQAFRSVIIYRPQDKANSDFGFIILNSQVLLIGDVGSLCDAVDRLERGTPAPARIVERARDMDIAYDFWAILLGPPSAMASERIPMADLAGKLKGFEAGIAVRDGVAMDVSLNTASESTAKEMAAEFSKMIHLVGKDHENHPQWAGIDRRLKMTVDRADLKFALRLDDKEVARMAKAFDNGQGRRDALTAKAREVMPQVTPPPPHLPPQKQVIRIEGLDDGPREIPYRAMPAPPPGRP
jgi:hypothetical protein